MQLEHPVCYTLVRLLISSINCPLIPFLQVTTPISLSPLSTSRSNYPLTPFPQVTTPISLSPLSTSPSNYPLTHTFPPSYYSHLSISPVYIP